MPRSRLLWKLYAGYVVLILVSTAIVGLLIGRQIEQDTLDEIRESLRVRAALLRDSALPSPGERPVPALQSRVRSLGAEIHTRLTVIRPDGTARKSLGRGGYDEHRPSLSPDNRLVVYVADTRYHQELYLRRVDGTGNRILLAGADGDRPVW